jgi:hypothetical protein
VHSNLEYRYFRTHALQFSVPYLSSSRLLQMQMYLYDVITLQRTDIFHLLSVSTIQKSTSNKSKFLICTSILCRVPQVCWSVALFERTDRI